MKRNIQFDVVVCDAGWDETGNWPTAKGPMNSYQIDIEFETDGDNVMRDAQKALAIHMTENHRDNYLISYWWWKDL